MAKFEVQRWGMRRSRIPAGWELESNLNRAIDDATKIEIADIILTWAKLETKLLSFVAFIQRVSEKGVSLPMRPERKYILRWIIRSFANVEDQRALLIWQQFKENLKLTQPIRNSLCHDCIIGITVNPPNGLAMIAITKEGRKEDKIIPRLELSMTLELLKLEAGILDKYIETFNAFLQDQGYSFGMI